MLLSKKIWDDISRKQRDLVERGEKTPKNKKHVNFAQLHIDGFHGYHEIPSGN